MGYYPAPGSKVPSGDLESPRAIELTELLESGSLPFLRLLEARTGADCEWLVIEVEPQTQQKKFADIRRCERILIKIDRGDARLPSAFALREDFPDDLPHLNLGAPDAPAHLCLSEEPESELRLRWTAAAFLRSIHGWLSATAVGTLHQPDQPLEPFLAGNAGRLVVPSDFFDPSPDPSQHLDVAAVGEADRRCVLAARKDLEDFDSEVESVVAVVITGQARAHGVIRYLPTTLQELHDCLLEAGVELRNELRDQLSGTADPCRPLVVIVRLPKTRENDGPVEAVEVWGFWLESAVDVCRAVGTHEMGDGYLVPIIGDSSEDAGEDSLLDVDVQPLRATSWLSKSRAQQLNDGHVTEDTPSITAVGLGALGSQIFMNLARSGFGSWSLVDHDTLLPHNLARHALTGRWLAEAKVLGSAKEANSLFDDGNLVESVALCRFSNLDGAEDLVRESDLVLDFTASVAFQRELALEFGAAGARRTSLFLNPAGSDLVLLAEDPERAFPLDVLEMSYLREMALADTLDGHLGSPSGVQRYARGCTDISSQIPQDSIAALAGIGARAIRLAAGSDQPSVSCWRIRDDVTIERVDISPDRFTEQQAHGWTLLVAESVIDTVSRLRDERLSEGETGGILVGVHDHQRKRLYVLGALPAPEDSEEQPYLFIRGVLGLQEKVAAIESATAGQVSYAGEWHSHPDGHDLKPSSDDATLFGWIEEHVSPYGLPPLMAIVGRDREARWYVGGL